MRNKANVPNTIPPTTNYPFGRLKNDTGVNDGTPIVEENNGDIQETVTYFMQRAKITPNELPDNVQNGYQIAESIKETAGKFNTVENGTVENNKIVVDFRLDNIYDKEFIMFNFLTSNQSDTQNVSGINIIRDVNGNEFQLFVYPDFQGNFFNNSLYIAQKKEDYFLIYSFANKTILDNIYEKLESLSNDIKDKVFEVNSFIVSANDFGFMVPVDTYTYETAIKCSLSWERQVVFPGGVIRTIFESSDLINMEAGQKIQFSRLSNSPNEIGISFTNFQGTVLNNVKLIVKCR